jgi:hypothetical protein
MANFDEIKVGDPHTEVTVADSSGNLYQAGSRVVQTMTPSSVITASAASYKSSIVRVGNIIKTTIVIGLTGLKSIATDLDIIGNTGVSHIGQITAAVNGTIFKGVVGVGAVPVGAAIDIDLYSADEGTGAYDAGIATLVETALVTSGGNHAVGTVKNFTAMPAANQYLYLTSGAATAGTYTSGIFYIEMWGTV